jgi:hypothetical protein
MSREEDGERLDFINRLVEKEDQTVTRLWTGGHPPTSGFVCHPDGEVEDFEEWCHTEFGPQISAQAWSEGRQPPEPSIYRNHHPWWKVGGLAAAILAVTGIATATVVGAAKPDDHNAWPPGSGVPPTPVAQVPTSPNVPEPPMPPWPPRDVADAAHITQDGSFLHLIGTSLNLSIGSDPAGLIEGAHTVCYNLGIAHGSKARLVAWQYIYNNPNNLSVAQISEWINDAASVYCPQYN